MSAVNLEHVSCKFGEVIAVDDVNIDIRAGEFVTLLGPSGCGKTTLLRMVAGLENGTGGRITIGGSIASDADRQYFVQPDRRRLGMVFQSYAIWPHMTVFDNVAYPLRIRRKSPTEIEAKVAEALRLVEMSQYAQRPAPALSGGQQQRVAIARALVFQPEVLLLDEPLSNLDAKLRLQMGDEFRLLQRKLGVTSLYVTHDQDEAMALSDRIVVMQSGRVLQIDAPEVLYRRPRKRAVATFFGEPNLLQATVIDQPSRLDGDSVRISDERWATLEGADWSARIPVCTDIEKGDAVTVIIRPESLRLIEKDEHPKSELLTWKGTIKNAVFRGPRRSVSVQTDLAPFKLDMPSGLPINGTDTVVIGVPSDQLWAVKD